MINHDNTRIASRTLTPGVRNALRRIIRYYRDRNNYSGCTSVRINITKPFGTFVSFHVTTFRSDCGRDSQRAILCEQDASGAIGPRGGITLYQAKHALKTEVKYVAKMLGAKIQ